MGKGCLINTIENFYIPLTTYIVDKGGGHDQTWRQANVSLPGTYTTSQPPFTSARARRASWPVSPQHRTGYR